VNQYSVMFTGKLNLFKETNSSADGGRRDEELVTDRGEVVPPSYSPRTTVHSPQSGDLLLDGVFLVQGFILATIVQVGLL
jgi:hypothetical protein